MINQENNQTEMPSQEAESIVQSQLEEYSSDLMRERVSQINQELEELSYQATSREDIQQIQEQEEHKYKSEVAELEMGLEIKLSQESKDMIHKNTAGDIIEQVQKNNERFGNLNRLKKATEILPPEDFLYFEKILGNKEGRVDQLYDIRGKVLHTTNNFYFGKMLESGSIKTGGGQEGMYGSRGASFTDGNFPEAVTFQTMYEDQNTHSLDKKFNSQNYGDKVQTFIRYFWDNKQEETKQYASKISGGKKVETFEDAVNIFEGFKFKAKPKELENDSRALSKLFGATIVYAKDKLPDLTKEGTEGLQKDFELRSYQEGGVPISEASTIFVPELQIKNMEQILQKHGLSHIEVRPSEELEVIRTVKLLEKDKK